MLFYRYLLIAFLLIHLAQSFAQTTEQTAVPTSFTPSGLGYAWDDFSPYQQGLRDHLSPDEQQKIQALFNTQPIYHLDYQLDETLGHLSVKGDIRFTNLEEDALDSLYLQLLAVLFGAKLDLEDVVIYSSAEQSYQPQTELQREGSLLKLDLAEALEPQESLVISLSYQLDLSQTTSEHYELLNSDGRSLSLAHSFPQMAVFEKGWRLELPPNHGDLAYSESSFFLVNIHHPQGLILASSGVNLETNSQETLIAAGPMRDFYLAASYDYGVLERKVNGLKLSSYYLPAQEQAATWILDEAEKIMTLFDELYGAYPYREIDLLPIHMIALGVEFPGIVGILANRYGAGALSIDQLNELSMVTAHELAHQWFYGLVGSNQVLEPWLDEGLTQYATGRYFASVGPLASNTFHQGLLSRWRIISMKARAIDGKVEDYSDREYGAIIYGYAPLALETLAEEVGQERFDDFLKDYSLKYRYELATAEDFFKLLEERCDCQVADRDESGQQRFGRLP
ncbi:MAG: M1 family metallopeptidase [Deinococcales bacterium]